MLNINTYRFELDQRHVAVWRADFSKWRPIPVALTPTRISSSQWQSVVSDARLVFSTFPKILKWLQLPDQSQLKAGIFSGLSGLEQFASDMDPMYGWGHVTTRFDLYWHGEEIKIIEVNCTIPAMQAYSDNVLNAWQIASGVVESSSSNVTELLQSLFQMYRIDGGMSGNPRIIILHRPGDSQMGELLWLKDHWNQLGVHTVLATPESVSRIGELWVVDGNPYDMIYRHIFAWRLPEGSVKDALLENRSFHIYNPISAHYESKAFLALASHLAASAALVTEVGITPEELSAMTRRVPWSRILGDGRFAIPFSDIKDRLPNLVLKRSVGYGGHQVFMGNEWDSPETQSRLSQLTGEPLPVTFEKFSTWAVTRDNSLWIAQERMSGIRRKTSVLCGDHIEEWDAWFDASVFINSRSEPICGGGVSRIAQSPIVNIGAGGGLAPFMLEADIREQP